MPRPLHVIASEIKGDWKKPYFGAIPYLDAMESLTSIEDKYFNDDSKTIILYLIANMSSYRGETARRIKLELKRMTK